MKIYACTLSAALTLLSACASTSVAPAGTSAPAGATSSPVRAAVNTPVVSTTTNNGTPPMLTPVVAVTTPPTRTVGEPDTDGGIDVKALVKEAGSLGYHVEHRHEERIYCRTDTPTNSHIPQRICITEADLRTRLNSEAVQYQQLGTQNQGAPGRMMNH